MSTASADAQGDSQRVVIAAPRELAPYLAAKGSITVDGISLTVNDVVDQADGGVRFGLNIIPHTAAMTTLDRIAPGRAVNLEIDVLARYLGRMEQLRARISDVVPA
jgi:riboflavin synthase